MKRELGLEAVRVYLGIAMFFRGVDAIRHGAERMSAADLPHLGFDTIALTHVVAAAHLVGGALLAVGMLTRVAAIAQIPFVLGALVFAPTHGFELSMLVLFLLGVVAMQGGGRWSFDRLVEGDDGALDEVVALPPMKPANQQEDPARRQRLK